jgi:hypothetical protein
MPATDTMPAPSLLTPVVYTDTNGKAKAALVIGTPESTEGKIAADQVSVLVYNPLTGNSYFRFARLAEDGTFHNRDESSPAEVAEDDNEDDNED